MSESEEAAVKRKRHGKDKIQKLKKQRKDDNGLANGASKLGETKGDDGLETPKSRKEKKQKRGASLEGTPGNVEGQEEPKSVTKDKKRKKRKETGGHAEQGAENGEIAELRDSTAGASEQASLGKENKQKKKGKNKDESQSGVQNRQNGAILRDVEVADPGKGEVGLTAAGKPDDVLVSVSGDGSENVKPYLSFDEAEVAANILDCCRGFERPSPIQAHAWPFLLAARDLIGIAATGSGKTLAFGVPALDHVLKKGTAQKRPLCLVIAPTRELCQQIAEVLEHAGRACGVKTACIYGGAPKGPQRTALRNGAVIVIATPGRLKDLLEEGCCSLDLVSFVVLDEADRMLDLGFEPDIRAIVGRTSKSRQTLMFSATWPVAVDQLAKEFMQDPSPIKVTVGSQGLAANHDVTQIVQVVDAGVRDSQLESLLRQYHKSRTNRVIVFVLYKKEAARVEEFLQRKGWKVGAVHGDKGQSDRNRAVASFKDGSCPLLVATDVAARGLDIPDVECVINYSFPLTTEDYVHRIGRTGRAGKKGIAHTFFTFADRARAGELVNVLKEAGQEIPQDLLKFGTHVKKKESKLYGAHFKEISADAPKASKITFDSDDD